MGPQCCTLKGTAWPYRVLASRQIKLVTVLEIYSFKEQRLYSHRMFYLIVP